MRFILRKGITAIEETKKMAVLRCCGFLKPGGFTASSAAVKQTCCQKFPTLRKEERVSLPGWGPAGFVPRERSHGSCHRRPAVPGRQGHWVEGWRSSRPAGQVSCSGPARGSGDRPSPAERGGSACAQSPTEEADATFLGVFMACQGGKVPSLSPLGFFRPSLLPRSSGGRREGPGAAQPRAHRDGARGRRSPPGAAARGLKGEYLVLPPSRGSL